MITVLSYNILFYLWIVYIMLGSVLMYDYGTILQHTVLFVDSLYNAGFCVDV